MNEEFYSHQFTCGKTEVSRGDLESLPCPFCTENIDDATMQKLADLTESGTRERTRNYNPELMSEDKMNEIWWEELESCCRYVGIPYYEDM